MMRPKVAKRDNIMFVNLTPHPIVYHTGAGGYISVPPSGTVARIDSAPGSIQEIVGGVPIYSQTDYGAPVGLPAYDPSWPGIRYIYSQTEYGAPVGLPAYDPSWPGIRYIVSALFAGRVPGRSDVIYPGTGPADNCGRNDKGQVEWVSRFIRA